MRTTQAVLSTKIHVLIACLGLAGCGDGGPPGADDGGPGPDGASAKVAPLVSAAISAGCTAKSLAAVAASGASPAQVRAAIRADDAKAKISKWTTGLSHGHPITAKPRIAELAKLTFNTSIYVPAGYGGDASSPMPLWVDPAHPTSKLKDDVWLPYLAKKTGERFIYITVNFMNRIFTDLDEATRKAITSRGTVFDQDYFSLLDAAIAQVMRAYHVDPNRVYVSGISAKGASSWFHGIASPTTYAALHPVSIIPAPFHKDLWLNLINLPALVWQGKADTVTPFDKVDPRIQVLKGYGLSIEYWVDPKGSHGGSLYYARLSDAASYLLGKKRQLTPGRVHRGIKSDRAASAYWLAVTGFTTPPDESLSLYPSAPGAVVDASWKDGQVTVSRAEGVTALELRWLEGAAGPGRGKAGDSLKVSLPAKAAKAYTLKEDATVALEAYCRTGDTSRLWAGRLKLMLNK